MTPIEESRRLLEDSLQQFFSEVDKELEIAHKNAEKTSEFKAKVTEFEERLSKTIQERDKLKTELSAIQDQLRRVSSLYEEASKEKTETKDLSELLAIYITLLEEVFAGRPHAKILYLLHGDKEIWTRNELNKSTGFEAAAILRALHELAAAELVTYDEDSNEVRVIKKLF